MPSSVVGRFSAPALSIVLATMTSCYDDSVHDKLIAQQEALQGQTGGSTDTDAAPGGSPVSTSLPGTAGAGSSDSSETSGGSGDDDPSSGGGALDLGDDLDPQATHPEIFDFTVTPDDLHAAGPLLFDLEVSDDVQEIELLRVDAGHDATLATLTPGDLPFERAIVSAADNGDHLYRAIVRNDQGEEARAELEVSVDLSGTGHEIWSWESEHLESEALAIIALGGGAVIAGYTVKNGEPSPVITRLSNTGQLLWEVTPIDGRGYACGLTLRPQGDLIVIGNSYKDGGSTEQAMWMRRLSPDGEVSQSWGDDGVTGERAVAVTTDESGQIVIAGDWQTSAMKPHHDLRVWAYKSDGASRWSESWTRPGVSFDRDEQAYAALVLPSGDILVAGHTSRDLFELPARRQALILKVNANGVFDDAPWIDATPEHYVSEVHGLTRDDKGDLFVAGRSAATLYGTPRATVWRIDEDLETQLWSRRLSQSKDAFAESVRLTANGDVVVGSTKAERFEVTIAKPIGEGPFLWQETIEFAEGPDRLRDLTLDSYDYIYVTGQATVGGDRRAYARRVSP